MTQVIDHGKWLLYQPDRRPEDAPNHAMFARRESDGVDWYDYSRDSKSFGIDTVKFTVMWQDRYSGFVVGAATRDVTELFPAGQMVLELTEFHGNDPQAELEVKRYDPDTHTLHDLPPCSQPFDLESLEARVTAVRGPTARPDMSDVSGIPYMGPMGMGNYFANPFPAYGTPQITSGQIQSPYMPEINNNQNTVNNLFNTPGGGGGFGRATDYYSQLGAQYSAAGMSPFGVFSEGGGGGGGASPYQTSANVWDTGASPFMGGGGSSGFGGSIYDYSGGLGSLGASPYMTTPNVWDTGSRGVSYPGTSGIDWSGLFGGGMGGGRQQDPFPGMSMPGGLNSPMTVPQQQPLDYGSLFGRGAGGMGSGATADPYPAMSMPGGLNSPMSGMDAPMEGAPSSTMDWSTLFGGDTGMTMPGGLNSPMTVPEAQAPAYDYGSLFGKGTEGAAPPAPDGTRTYDLAPMFEGGGGGFGTGRRRQASCSAAKPPARAATPSATTRSRPDRKMSSASLLMLLQNKPGPGSRA